MKWLELKVPPPVVGLLVASLMWLASSWPPTFSFAPVVRVGLAGTLAAIGLGFDLLGLWAFLRSRTTINPLRPDKSSVLVTDGVYRISRNPMYVGMLFLLTAWAVYLAAPWPFLGPPLFVAFISRFQISPEERVLERRFGEFQAYAARVRRWL